MAKTIAQRLLVLETLIDSQNDRLVKQQREIEELKDVQRLLAREIRRLTGTPEQMIIELTRKS